VRLQDNRVITKIKVLSPSITIGAQTAGDLLAVMNALSQSCLRVRPNICLALIG
jgi:hypothetical protein